MDDTELSAFCDASIDVVYRYARRLAGGDAALTEDLVQDTYVALVRRNRAEPDDDVDVGWLIVTCRHRFLDELRRARRTPRRWIGDPESVIDTSSSAGSPVVTALGRLRPVARAAIVLSYVDGLPVAEVAASIGRGEHATESILRRARADLRSAYEAAERKAQRDE